MDGFPPFKTSVQEGQAKDTGEKRPEEEEEEADQYDKVFGLLNDGREMMNPQEMRAEEQVNHQDDTTWILGRLEFDKDETDFGFLRDDYGEKNPQETGGGEEVDPNSNGRINFNEDDYGILNDYDGKNYSQEETTNKSETEKRRMRSEEETRNSTRKRQCTNMVSGRSSNTILLANQTTNRQQHFRGIQNTELNRVEQGSSTLSAGHNHFNQPSGMEQQAYLNAADSVAIPPQGGRIVDRNLNYLNRLSSMRQYVRSLRSDDFMEQMRMGTIPSIAQIRASVMMPEEEEDHMAYMQMPFGGQQPLGPPMNMHQPIQPQPQLNQQMHQMQQQGGAQFLPQPQINQQVDQMQEHGGAQFLPQPQLNQQMQQHGGAQFIPRPQGFNAGESSKQGRGRGRQQHDGDAWQYSYQGRGGRGRGRDQR